MSFQTVGTNSPESPRLKKLERAFSRCVIAGLIGCSAMFLTAAFLPIVWLVVVEIILTAALVCAAAILRHLANLELGL